MWQKNPPSKPLLFPLHQIGAPILPIQPNLTPDLGTQYTAQYTAPHVLSITTEIFLPQDNIYYGPEDPVHKLQNSEGLGEYVG